MLDRIARVLAGPMPPPRRLRRIAIVGGGFTGAVAAIAIADAVKEPLELVLFAPDGPLGGGLAYGKARPSDLLNVRARDLSVHSDAPEDFAEWLAVRREIPLDSHGYRQLCESFAPRTLFGDYVRQRLGEAVRRAPLLHIVIERREVTAIRPLREGRYAIEAADGEPVKAGVVILATGYGAAAPRFGLSPYDQTLPTRLAAAKSLLVVGSGLSMVDVVLAARREGWEGNAEIVSRHGLVPLSHAPVAVRPPAYRTAGGTSVVRLMQRLRTAAALAVEEGRPWQGEINRLRPHAADIWQSLSTVEQSRFLRRARRQWDVHRHRIPAAMHQTLRTELVRERTRLTRGRVVDVTGAGPFAATVVRPGGAEEQLAADLVVDCTGFVPAVDAPVVRSLIAEGLAELDPLGLGLAVASDGRVMPGGARGEPDLFALGPLGFGSLFEITSAPEIIRQARAAAATIRDLLDLDADPFDEVQATLD